MSTLTEYLWIPIVGGIFAFGYGFLIGANDVANAFASSVSSKSLTLTQAVCCASVFEFLGAVGLGAAVTSTVRSKIINIDLYKDDPAILMYGMFTSLIAGNIVLFVATHLGLPVSTTHDIVGCIMGFSIAAKGFGSVKWDVVTKLFLSWIASPGIAGILGLIFFGSIRYGIMNSEHCFERAYNLFPVILTLGIGIDMFYVLYKGLNNTDAGKLPVYATIPIAIGVGFLCGMLWLYPFGPWVRKRIEGEQLGETKEVQSKEVESYSQPVAPHSSTVVGEELVVEEVDCDDITTLPVVLKNAPVEKTALTSDSKNESDEDDWGGESDPENLLQKFAKNTVNRDLRKESLHENEAAKEIWENAIEYDPKAERLFNFIQVFTACLNSFAHGANDVANTIAPFSAIVGIYQTGEVQSSSPVPKWILAYGGFAIVMGLLLYGYRVMKSIGYKLTMLSPSRGASAELAASFTVVTASFLEIPVSSTQCIVGAVMGVGLVNGHKNVNWWFLLRVTFGWVVNFFMATTISALLFSFAYYSPVSQITVNEVNATSGRM